MTMLRESLGRRTEASLRGNFISVKQMGATQFSAVRVLARVMAAGTILMLGSGLSSAATITNVQLLSAADGGAVLAFSLGAVEGVVPAKSFATAEPARIVVDMPGTLSLLPRGKQNISSGIIEDVTVVSTENRSRIVVSLNQLLPHTAIQQGDKLLLQIGGVDPMPLIATAAPANPPPVVTPAYEAPNDVPRLEIQQPESSTRAPAATSERLRPAIRSNQVEVRPVAASTAAVLRVDFRRNEAGAGRIVFDLSSPSSGLDIRKRGGNLVAEIADIELPEALRKKFDVLDFGTPVRSFRTRQRRDKAVVEIDAFGDFDYSAYQTDARLVIEVRPLSQEELAEEQETGPVYTGEPISLNFQSIEIARLMQVLADFAGVNIVVSDDVQGDIAMRLVNVPWDQALDLVLLTKNLDKRREGNVILIDTTVNIATRERAARAARDAELEVAPVRTELIQINYAKASELAELIDGDDNNRNVATSFNQNSNNRIEDNGLLSVRGQISVDERTNTLVVQDTLEKIIDIRRLVEKLDIPVRQVLIETRIVVANDDFSKDVGVRFGLTAVDRRGSNGLLAIGGTSTGNNVIIDSARNGDSTLNIPGSGGGTLADRFGVNLPALPTGVTPGSIGLAFLGRDVLIDLELSALQAEGKGELLSTPRVITANQKEARIEQGVEIPFQQSTSSGATSITFKKAVLSLTVTPQITPDNRVILDLDVTSDARGEDTVNGPAIDTRQVETQVLVNNGETVVLGGIYEQDKRETVSKVPLLGDIPFAGRLFRRNTSSNMKRELLIFVTPKILDESLSIQR